jgi:ferredoxin
MAYRIRFDKEKCLGCGACAAQCDNWGMKDGKAYPKKTMLKEKGCNKTAAEVCPVEAIDIIEE